MAAYVHEVYTDYGFAGIKHIRETQTASGIIIPRELARSSVEIDAERFVRDHSSASNFLTFSSLLKEMQPTKTVQCADIQEFVTKGLDAWRGGIALLGDYVRRIEFDLKENEIIVDSYTTDSGIVVPLEPYSQFDGYVATPDEIDALENLIEVANKRLVHAPDTDNEAPGLYL